MRIKLAEDVREQPATIRVIGVGGGGGNAVNRMIQAEAAIDVLDDGAPSPLSAMPLDVADERDVDVLLLRVGQEVTPPGLDPDVVPGARMPVVQHDERSIDDVAALVAPVRLMRANGGALAEAPQPLWTETAVRAVRRCSGAS